jgi:hypothetical protein
MQLTHLGGSLLNESWSDRRLEDAATIWKNACNTAGQIVEALN